MTTTATAPKQDHTAPKAAFQLSGSPVQWMDAETETDVRPFKMMARSADAIEHWYWGRIVHDLSGMQLRKATCPVDYNHDSDKQLGFADAFNVTDEGLEVSGSLIILEPNDQADKIFKRGKAGFPYESSIDWVGPDMELEYIPEAITTEVNGRQFEGPGYVVRKWPLRSVAICPYGADSNTETKFSDGEPDSVSVRVFTNSRKDHTVSEDIKTETSTVPDAPQQHTGITTDTLRQFNDAFGDQAMTYLTAGLSFDAAKLQFADHRVALADAKVKQFQEERDAALKAKEEAELKLQQFGDALGQRTPIDTGGGEPEKKKLFSNGKVNRGK